MKLKCLRLRRATALLLVIVMMVPSFMDLSVFGNVISGMDTRKDEISVESSGQEPDEQSASPSDAVAADQHPTDTITIEFIYEDECIDSITIPYRQYTAELKQPEGFSILAVSYPDDLDRTYQYNPKNMRLKLDEQTQPEDTLQAVVKPMLIIDYFYDGSLVDTQEVLYNKADGMIPVLNGTMFDILLDITDPATGESMVFDADTKSIEAAEIYGKYAAIHVHVDPQNHPVTIYYQNDAGDVIAAQNLPSSDDNRIIYLTGKPAYHDVISIESDAGDDLTALYHPDDNSLELGLLQEGIILYITVKPVYVYFKIIPYFENADYNSSEDRYVQGDASPVYALADQDILTAAADVSHPSGTSLSFFTYQVDEADFDGETEPGVAVYSVYYNRRQYLMVFNAGEGRLDTSVPYNYAQQLRYGQTMPVEAEIPDPIRPGYEFSGQWVYVNTDTNETIAKPDVMPAHNITAYAQWTPGETLVRATVVYHYQNIYDDNYTTYGTTEVLAQVASHIKLDHSTGRDRGSLYYTKGQGKEILSANHERPEYEFFDYIPQLDQNAVLEDSGIEVKGDGSTVINVYYNRNSYEFTFNMQINKGIFGLLRYWATMDINNNGTIITYNRNNPNYLLKARYGEDIYSRWPAGINVSNFRTSSDPNNASPAFGGWNKTLPDLVPNANGDAIHHAYMDAALIREYGLLTSRKKTVYAIVMSYLTVDQYTLTVMQENFDYDKPPEASMIGEEKVKVPGKFNQEVLNTIPGTITPSFGAGTLIQQGSDYTANYLKRRYTLFFHANGGQFEEDVSLNSPAYDHTYITLRRQAGGEELKQERQMQYGADLLKYGYQSYHQILPVREHYRFTGWDRSPLGQSGINWDTPVLIPADELDAAVTYYAKWEKLHYNVRFYDTLRPVGNGYFLMQQSSVEYLNTIPVNREPATAKPGYNFLGWYTYVNGIKVSYTAGLPITGDTDIYGEWEAVERVPYRVLFQNSSGAELAPPTAVRYGGIGQAVTVYAEAYIPDMIPQSASKTVVLESGTNDIVFIYEPVPEGLRAQYSIECLDNQMRPILSDITIIIDGKSTPYKPGDLITLPEGQWSVTVKAPQIPGYQPMRIRYNNISLGANPEGNVFRFQYVYIGAIPYELGYYDIYGNEIMPPVQREGVLNQVIRNDNTSEVAIPIEGYEFSYSAFKRENMSKELRYPTLTLSSGDTSADVPPRMNLYYVENISYGKEPQSVLTELGSVASLNATVQGAVWIDGELMSKIHLYRVIGDIYIPVAASDQELTFERVNSGRDTAVSWSIPSTNSDFAGVYQFCVDGVYSAAAVVSFWSLDYADDKDALYTTSSVTGGAEIANDRAEIKLYSGEVNDVQMGYETTLVSTVGSVAADMDYESVAADRMVSGYTVGNSRIALSVKEDPENLIWNIGLYNYNAVTASAKGEVLLTITAKVANFNPISCTVPLKVKMNPAQIDVAVPLNLVAVTDMEGGEAEVPDMYHVNNKGGFPLVVNAIEATPQNAFVIVKKEQLAAVPAKEIAIVIINSVTGEPIALSAGVNDLDALSAASLRIPSNHTVDLGIRVFTSPFDYNMTENQVKFATVGMTIKIPE